ncbi:outer membrane protein [Terricaulis sp.]|uniref:outer membrane protein n=1 Tax=Terricaulis sp. TaxID=2768686 RepID=UPI003784D03B
MKKLVSGVAFAACAMAMASRADALELGKVFVEAGVGPVFSSDVDVDGAAETAESSANAFVAIGLSNVGGGPVDVRLEYATSDRDYENSLFAQLQSSSVMLNATYNIPAGPMTLYAGGGLGVIEVEFHGMPGFFDGVDGSDAKVVWQLVGGARMPLFSGPLALFAEGRYQDAGTASIDGVDVEYNSFSAMAGLRWTF